MTQKNFIPGYTSKKKKGKENPIQKDRCIPIFIATLFIIVKIGKQPKHP